MIDLKESLLEKNPDLKEIPGSKLLFKTLTKLFRVDDINKFIKDNQHLRGFEFLDKILQHFNFTYQATAKSLNNIPSEGRVLIVANHPIGSLDGLALLKMVHSIRPDVRIVANELLSKVEPLQSLFLPVKVFSSGRENYRNQYKAMLNALKKEEALIIFPAGEVSRIKPNGVRDGLWKPGFLKLAKRTKSPILPILVDAKNSTLFYSLSLLFKPLGTAMLVREMFNKEDHELQFHIGHAIPWSELESSDLTNIQLAKLFRKQLYRLAKRKKKSLFNTVETIVHPARRKALKTELYKSELLGETSDGKKIFLYDYQPDSPVIHEIGRLRELSFRTVEEGTGKVSDIDQYDCYYRHIVLWDEDDLEIVGAYRIAECKKIIENDGSQGLYTQTLFDFKESLNELLPDAIELGRSFVQPRYWGKRSLDYLWFGIGAYLRQHPEIKYLFGPVSLSTAYSPQSQNIIIAFYQQQFGTDEKMAVAKTPYLISDESTLIAEQEFSGDYKHSYRGMNKKLKKLGVKVPTLYKQYSEICEDKGCQFLAFNIDADFNYCIDSLILVDLNKLKANKRARYIGEIETDFPILEFKKKIA